MSSLLLEKAQAIQHHFHERLATMRARQSVRRSSGNHRRQQPSFTELLEQRVLLSTVSPAMLSINPATPTQDSLISGTPMAGISNNVTFAKALKSNTGSYPWSITEGDFNGDGALDVAVADTNGGMSVLLGNGNGTFQPAVNYAAGSDPIAVTVGDFNGDGKADLAVANDQGGSVSVLLGNGNGTFQAAVNYAAGSDQFRRGGRFQWRRQDRLGRGRLRAATR